MYMQHIIDNLMRSCEQDNGEIYVMRGEPSQLVLFTKY